MAVHIHHHIHIIADVLDKAVKGGGCCHTNCVRDIDDVAMHLFNCLKDAMQKFRRGTGGIHGREETGPAMILDQLYRFHSSGHDLIMAHLYGMSDLDIGGRRKNMHHAHIGVEAGLYILFYYAREAADLGLQPGSGYLPYALKLALGGYWKAGLDDIDSQFIKLSGDLELILLGQ